MYSLSTELAISTPCSRSAQLILRIIGHIYPLSFQCVRAVIKCRSSAGHLHSNMGYMHDCFTRPRQPVPSLVHKESNIKPNLSITSSLISINQLTIFRESESSFFFFRILSSDIGGNKRPTLSRIITMTIMSSSTRSQKASAEQMGLGERLGIYPNLVTTRSCHFHDLSNDQINV